MKLMKIFEEMTQRPYYDNLEDAIASGSNSAYKRCIFYDRNRKKYLIVRFVDKQKYLSNRDFVYVPSELED